MQMARFPDRVAVAFARSRPWRAVGVALALALAPWVARGQALVNGILLKTGDGAAATGEADLAFVGHESAELLVFDLA
jgi:hypothetical protein